MESRDKITDHKYRFSCVPGCPYNHEGFLCSHYDVNGYECLGKKEDHEELLTTDDNQPIDELVEEEPADVCEYCHGTGKVPKLILDRGDNLPPEGMWVESGELETCICKIEK